MSTFQPNSERAVQLLNDLDSLAELIQSSRSNDNEVCANEHTLEGLGQLQVELLTELREVMPAGAAQ